MELFSNINTINSQFDVFNCGSTADGQYKQCGQRVLQEYFKMVGHEFKDWRVDTLVDQKTKDTMNERRQACGDGEEDHMYSERDMAIDMDMMWELALQANITIWIACYTPVGGKDKMRGKLVGQWTVCNKNAKSEENVFIGHHGFHWVLLYNVFQDVVSINRSERIILSKYHPGRVSHKHEIIANTSASTASATGSTTRRRQVKPSNAKNRPKRRNLNSRQRKAKALKRKQFLVLKVGVKM